VTAGTHLLWFTESLIMRRHRGETARLAETFALARSSLTVKRKSISVLVEGRKSRPPDATAEVRLSLHNGDEPGSKAFGRRSCGTVRRQSPLDVFH